VKDAENFKSAAQWSESSIRKSFPLLRRLVIGLASHLPAIAADYDVLINNFPVTDPEKRRDDVANVGFKREMVGRNITQ